jgi:hypothetical protein
MKCAVHTELDASGFCRNCGKALCGQCARPVREALYCEDCLAAQLGVPATPPVAAVPAALPAAPAVGVQQSTVEPALACLLGFIPGVGAIVNGEYMKAVVQVLIFGSLIALLDSDLPGSFDALFGIGLAAFYLYMPIDAYRVARARRDGHPIPTLMGAGGSDIPLGATVLVALGLLLLLSNLGLLHGQITNAIWPAGLIALGGWLLWRRSRGEA